MLLFVIGLFIGALIGVAVTALCGASSKADRHAHKINKHKK